MVSIKGLTAAFVICLVFFIGMITVAINLQAQNGVTNSVSSDPYINQTYNDIKSSITNQQSTADAQSTAFSQETPKQDAFSQASDTIGTSTKTITGVTITGSFKLLAAVIQSRLGIDPIIITAIGIILATTLILILWKAIRWGE